MTFRHPLDWPQGRPRTAQRKAASWHKKKDVAQAGGGFYRATANITMDDAVRRLRDQFKKLKVDFADDVQVSTNLRTNMSGLPRADSGEPSDPGVAVYWIDPGTSQRRCMAIDAYTTVKDNVAAVAASLDCLRALERYGGAEIREQAMTAFNALPPPKTCWDVLDLPEQQPGDPGAEQRIRMAHKIKAMSAHPDVRGGSTLNMAEINDARDVALKIVGGQS